MSVEGSDAPDRLRLAELLAALSLTTDLGMGFPAEHAARACLLATHLGRRLGLPEADVADVYYTRAAEAHLVHRVRPRASELRGRGRQRFPGPGRGH